MKVSVVPIGNSRGVRIPKAILDQCDIQSEVDLDVRDGKIILEPVRRKPRSGWSEAFAEMSAEDDDRLLIDDAIDLASDDWEW